MHIAQHMSLDHEDTMKQELHKYCQLEDHHMISFASVHICMPIPDNRRVEFFKELWPPCSSQAPLNGQEDVKHQFAAYAPTTQKQNQEIYVRAVCKFLSKEQLCKARTGCSSIHSSNFTLPRVIHTRAVKVLMNYMHTSNSLNHNE